MSVEAREQLLLTFYGDDFTGSTDALEALSINGVPAVLFLRAPSVEDLKRFPDCRAAGVAGISRSQSPEWMDVHLPSVFESLRALGARLCHYKVCSTFDSSPTCGSIGRATELGRQVFGTRCVPVLVGVPRLRRYVLFGNLFACVDGETYRIDRHPTMSRHPVTPMSEGDLRRHFARQSGLSISSVDILALQAWKGLERFEQLRSDGFEVALFDTLDLDSLREAGRAIWESNTSFAIGSSGVEYALLGWWKSQGMLRGSPTVVDPAPVDRLAVISGSCSPVTAEQIEWALKEGFRGVAIDAAQLVSGESEYARALEAAQKILGAGKSLVLYSAAGPKDVIRQLHNRDLGQQIGSRLGALAADVMRRAGLERIVIAGGDTSGHAGKALGIEALTVIRSFAPGGPLCRIWSQDGKIDGSEILLKGGQVGGKEIFGDVKRGRVP